MQFSPCEPAPPPPTKPEIDCPGVTLTDVEQINPPAPPPPALKSPAAPPPPPATTKISSKETPAGTVYVKGPTAVKAVGCIAAGEAETVEVADAVAEGDGKADGVGESVAVITISELVVVELGAAHVRSSAGSM